MFNGVPELSTAIDTKKKASVDKSVELDKWDKPILRECKKPDARPPA
jgi:hypothetical protein